MSKASDIIEAIWAEYVISEEILGRERFVRAWRTPPSRTYHPPVKSDIPAEFLNTPEQDC